MSRVPRKERKDPEVCDICGKRWGEYRIISMGGDILQWCNRCYTKDMKRKTRRPRRWQFWKR